MSVKVMVEHKGKRSAVSVAPMAPLQKIIEIFCFQQKPQLDVSGCQLFHQKKLLDPTIPVRFANLPKEAKLELVTAQPEQRLGLADKPAPTSSAQLVPVPPAASSLQADAAPAPPELPSAQPASPSTMYQSVETTPDQPHRQTHSAQPPANSTSTSAAAQNAALQGQSSSQTASASQPAETSDTPVTSFNSDAVPIPAGLDRQIHVFTREAAAAAEASSRGITDLPPEFYDFTPDDYQKVMSSWAKQNSQGAGPLKTQKLREQDERRRAEQFGPVPVRVHFPDGTIVQAEFRPTETLSSLQKLLQQCMQPSLTQWHMYVTPPKQVFKDLSLTFYKAGLLPAANVLIGLDSRHEGPCLKSEIATLQAAPPARNIVRQTSKVDAPGAHRGNVGSGAHFLPSSKATGEKKVPKWMKLGK